MEGGKQIFVQMKLDTELAQLAEIFLGPLRKHPYHRSPTHVVKRVNNCLQERRRVVAPRHQVHLVCEVASPAKMHSHVHSSRRVMTDATVFGGRVVALGKPLAQAKIPMWIEFCIGMAVGQRPEAVADHLLYFCRAVHSAGLA